LLENPSLGIQNEEWLQESFQLTYIILDVKPVYQSLKTKAGGALYLSDRGRTLIKMSHKIKNLLNQAIMLFEKRNRHKTLMKLPYIIHNSYSDYPTQY
jgi:hypothetical protein